MSIFTYIILFSLLGGAVSLIGGVLLLLEKSETVRSVSAHLISFAAGALLSTAFFEALPEALEHGGAENFEPLLLATLVGIVGFFIMERLILKLHTHRHEDDHHHSHAAPYLLLMGDLLHNFVDGVVIAAATMVSIPAGLVTALAVSAHEIPQEIGDFSVMLHHGWSKMRVFWINLWASLASVLGAIITFLARETLAPTLPYLLALSGGIFVYIAAADLLPEVTDSEQARDKTGYVISLFLLGILVVWGLGELLPH